MGEALITRSGSGNPDAPVLKWITVSEVITSNSTYTVPANIRNSSLHVRCFGGGGSSSQYNCGGGGGNMNNADITLAAGSQVPITIGAGGLTPINNGGTTSFGSYISATGGWCGYNSPSYGYGKGGTGGGHYNRNAMTSGQYAYQQAYYGGAGGGILHNSYPSSIDRLEFGGLSLTGIYGGQGGLCITFHAEFANNNPTFTRLKDNNSCQINNMIINLKSLSNSTNLSTGGNGVNLYSSSETYDNGVKIGGYGRPGNGMAYQQGSVNCIATGGCGGYGGNGGNGASSKSKIALAGGGGGGYGGHGGDGFVQSYPASGGGGGYGGNGANGSPVSGGGGGGYGPQNYGAGGGGTAINGYNGMHGCVVISYQQLSFG